MATHGTVSKFQPGKEDWSTYVEQLNYYFAANGVTAEETKRSVLLANCGSSTFKLIRSLIEADKIDTTPYNDIVATVKNYYEPRPSEIVQRYKFNTRVRRSGETVAAYVAALRELAEHCNYGNKLQEMLRDRLVCGVNHPAITRKLLSEKELTYDKAYACAQSIEASERDSTNFKQKTPTPTDSSGDQQLNYQSPRGKHGLPFKKGTVTCYRCGGPHLASTCKCIDLECRFCKKKGHLARVCRAKQQQQQRSLRKPKQTHFVETTAEDSDDAYGLYTVREQQHTPITVTLYLNSTPVIMELDTGASISVLSEATYQQLASQGSFPSLQPSEVKLKSYTGQDIPVLGSASVEARYDTCVANVLMQVVDGDGPNLLGRDLLHKLGVNLGSFQLNAVEETTALNELLGKYESVFSEELGCMQGPPVHLHVDEKAKPKFCKPRSVPFMLKGKVEAELQRLQDVGIISPIKHSKWAAPIVPVLKKNGTVRLCGDYKVTVNKALLNESYPLPKVEELFASLAGGKYFTKLDMSNAYLQLPLDDASKEYLVINTHKGLFQYNRLPFGVASAPSIFQRQMDNLMQGLKGVFTFLDDILVTGSTLQEHFQNLEAVFQQLKQANLHLNKAKCFFLQPFIEYLGHMIDAKGRHPTEDKIKAIREARTPATVTELRAFLGIINYYGKFLPNLSTQLAPLYTLLGKNAKWSWGTAQEKAFQTAKEALQGNSLLVH